MDDDAVSEVVGSVLLVALAVVLLSGFGALVFANLTSETATAPSGAFSMAPRAGESFVDVTLLSGTPFDVNAATFALAANNSSSTSSYLVSTATDGRIHPGDYLRVNLTRALAASDRLALFVVHKETGKTIGSAYSTVIGANELPAYVANVPTIIGTGQTPAELVTDGMAVANLSVTIQSTFGLDFVQAVWLNLTPIGGPPTVFLRDDGTNGDALAKDGTFSGQATASNYNFSTNPGAQSAPILATVRDVLGHESNATMQLALRSPLFTKVIQGAVWRALPAASYATNLNVTNFSFRDVASLDDDLLEVRISDLIDPSKAWTALVKFNSTGCGGAPAVTSVTLTLDGTPGNATLTPTSGCFPLNQYSRLNLIDPTASLNATNATQTWTIPGSIATFAFTTSGIGSTNQGAVTFLGDATAPGVSRTGFGQGDITWAQSPAGILSAPQAPTNFVATPGAGQVALSWTASVTPLPAPVTSHTVYMSTTSGAETFFATLGSNTSFTANGLTNGVTYYFQVSSNNSVGASPRSAEAFAIPVTVPDAPQSLSGTPWNGAAALSWSAPSSDGGTPITSYNVYRNGTLLASVPGNTTFNATGLSNGVSYSFTVKAVNAVGEGAASNSAGVTPRTIPDAPASLGATVGNGSIALSWTPSFNGGSALTGYNVFVNGTLVASTTNGGNTTFTVNSLLNGVSYAFNVSATNVVGEGPKSAGTSAVPSTVPNPPTALSPTAGNVSVALSWTAPANDGSSPITSYNVYRNGTLLASTGGVNTTFTVNSLANGVLYTFNVTAVNANGESAKSNTVTSTPLGVPFPPASLSPTPGNASVALSWSAPSNTGGSAITNYKIYRNGTLLATIGTNTTFTANSLLNGVSYSFTVTAVNAVGESAVSNAVASTPVAVPFPPSGLSATPGNVSAALSWTAPTNTGGSAITNYKIYRNGTLLATIGTNTTFTANSLSNGVLYTFTVTAVNAVGESAVSNSATATPVGVPFPPTGLGGTIGNGTVSLSWTAPTNTGGTAITNYRIYRNGTYLAATGGVNTTFAANTLINGVSYSFTVTAVNAQGESAVSGSIARTPATVPIPPSGLGGVADHMFVSLTWTAPGNNGGSAITNYEIYRNGTLLTTTGGSNTSFTVNNLINGVLYTFNVRAVNAIGTSANSNTASATPVAPDLFFSCSPSITYGTATNCANMQSSSDSGAFMTLQEDTTSGKYALDMIFTSQGTGPAGPTHELQMRARCSAGCGQGDTLSLKLYDGSTYTTRFSITDSDTTFTTFTYTMTTAEWRSGLPQFQFVDGNRTGADGQNSWEIDYIKVVTT